MIVEHTMVGHKKRNRAKRFGRFILYFYHIPIKFSNDILPKNSCYIKNYLCVSSAIRSFNNEEHRCAKKL